MNVYTFLVGAREDIESIPGIVSRLDVIEAHLADLGVSRYEEFDQGDHDELFADSGATERSFDQGDHDEFFADSGATERSYVVSDHFAVLHASNTPPSELSLVPDE